MIHRKKAAWASGRRSRSGTSGIGLPWDEAMVATDIRLGSTAAPPTLKARAVVEYGEAVISGDAVPDCCGVDSGVQFSACGIGTRIRGAGTNLAVTAGCRAYLARRVRRAGDSMQT